MRKANAEPINYTPCSCKDKPLHCANICTLSQPTLDQQCAGQSLHYTYTVIKDRDIITLKIGVIYHKQKAAKHCANHD